VVIKGFTLLELVIVIIIIGILATLGIQQYIPARERALEQEAVSNLQLIRQAERIYRMEMGTYYPAKGREDNITNINNALKLSLNENNWDYYIDGGQDAFTAYAERLGRGGYLDCRYSINQTQDKPIVSSSPGTCAYIP
jgi:prepilin-type N-terminal cleavage/methylation domain-containing protein